jgi:hypothetical protein
MPETPAKEYTARTIEALLALRAHGAFRPAETAPGRGVHRWEFRAGGWPVSVDLDANVLSIRVYLGREEITMGRVPGAAMDALLGRAPPPKPLCGEEQALEALREVVAEWRDMNPRLFMSPPSKVGHPDNWNGA